jgi:hypothetical protein
MLLMGSTTSPMKLPTNGLCPSGTGWPQRVQLDVSPREHLAEDGGVYPPLTGEAQLRVLRLSPSRRSERGSGGLEGPRETMEWFSHTPFPFLTICRQGMLSASRHSARGHVRAVPTSLAPGRHAGGAANIAALGSPIAG